ncbi:MAG: (2Fe-2S) ferredoxin domain-containing protein [Deferribacterales bacterium]
MLYDELLDKVKLGKLCKTVEIDVCIAAGCLALGSEKLIDELKGRFPDYEVKGVGCIGLCSKGPLIKIESGNKIIGAAELNIDQLVAKINELIQKPHQTDNFF